MGFLNNLRNDFDYARGIVRALMRITPMARHKERTFIDVADELAVRYGDKPAIAAAKFGKLNDLIAETQALGGG